MNSTDVMKLRMLLHVVDVHCTFELKLKNQFDIRLFLYVRMLFTSLCTAVCL